MSAFEWLYDGMPEDGLEDCAYLRGDLAPDPAAAVRIMTELYERDAGRLSDYGDGRAFGGAPKLEWRRAEITMYDDDGEETGTFLGSKAEAFADFHDRCEELRYGECEPDDEGALQFWRVPLIWPDSQQPADPPTARADA